MEGNASVYQVNPVSRITGEGGGRSFEGRGGLVLIKSERVWRGGGGGGGGGRREEGGGRREEGGGRAEGGGRRQEGVGSREYSAISEMLDTTRNCH